MKKTQVIENISNINKELSTSDNSKYTTVNGAKEFDSKDGYIDNIVIEGDTLVNLYDKSDFGKITSGDNHFVIVDNNHMNSMIHSGTYSVLFKGSFIKGLSSEIKSKDKNLSIRTVEYSGSSSILQLGENEKIGTFYINKELCSLDQLSNMAYMAMVLEGDHVNKDIPYFEGMKSTGGIFRVEALNYVGDNIKFELESGDINLDNGASGDLGTGNFRAKDFINVSDIDNCVATMDTHYILYDENKNFIKSLRGVVSGTQIDVSNCHYIKLWTWGYCSSIRVLKNYSIDKSLINKTLRGIKDSSGNLVCRDTVEPKLDRYIYHRRCSEIQLGNKKHEYSGDLVGLNGFYRIVVFLDEEPHPKIGLGHCDKFSSEVFNWENPTRECFYNNVHSDRTCFTFAIRMDRFPQGVPVNESMQKYLEEIKPTIVYELKEPTSVDVDNFNLKTFKGKNNFILNSGMVQAEAQFEVTNTLRDEINVLESKVSSLDDSVQKSFQYGIDTKKKLVDKVNSIGGDVSTEDSFDKIIEGISGGKKWASGLEDVNISCENGTFLDYTYRFKVDNLSFKPSVIHIYFSWQKNEVTRHSSGCFYLYDFKDGNNSYGASQFYHSATGRMTPFNLSDSNNKIFYVEYGGFCLPIYGLYSYSSDTIKTVKWVAYE